METQTHQLATLLSVNVRGKGEGGNFVCETIGNMRTRMKVHIYILIEGMPDKIRTATLIDSNLLGSYAFVNW